MIATDDTNLYHRLLELKDQGRRAQGTGGDDLHPTMGFNFKLANLQAALGIAQLGRLEQRLAQARRRDAWYRASLQDCPGVDVSRLCDVDGEVRQWADVLIEDRAATVCALTESGIGSRAFWFPVHTQAPYARTGTDFPISARISPRGLWLPSGFDLTQEDVERVSSAIRRAAARN
jgi:perosamine synthetase